MNESEILEKHSDERSKCVVYQRCIGYYRPVETFNIGKQGEHNERKFFKEELDTNE